ncbi:MAG TPA: (2Fe-2S) ferredoxin domain-containing protein [Sphaerochaeta sp.]|jgi:NADP-reducing hydrogenase subunit HndB|nr:(2Fe-2S) ferredoxin domain-containing protein [Spirochaetota bacterium]NLV61200.1 (2Fe-2S) ferredoxin domain-containing protein [Spirochaetales bacterium]HOE84205.1 (2Fe-2S) ferredoxin domain-containing protein [Sphaerochaeta sp.]HPY11038.1 (2Fe-2S) ferredoxin domain-containing protein [Sphaerochaeta sp.]
MAKMTLEELRSLRERVQGDIQKRDIEGKDSRIIIGMGTCGIAAGAKDTLDAFLAALDEHKLTNISVTQTGCMGLCYVEPTIEVIVPGMPNVIYGKVDKKTAKKIVEEHLMAGRLVTDHIFDRPAADIIKKDGGK